MEELIEIDGKMILHELIPIKPDGNCLFGTLSYLMYKTENRSNEIRVLIVDHVISKWDYFQVLSHDKFGNNYTSETAYSNEMSKNGTYGSLCELIAAGEIFDFSFEVFVDKKLYVKCGDVNKEIKRLRFTGSLSDGHFDAYQYVNPRCPMNESVISELDISNSNYIQNDSFFGIPCVFNDHKLPTKNDVLLRLFLCYDDEWAEKKKSFSLHSFIDIVATEIENIWKKTKIPIILRKSIKVKLSRLIDEYQRSIKLKPNSEVYKKTLSYLFDIARCKCINNCKCLNQNKILSSEMAFISDQRDQRLLMLPTIDPLSPLAEDSDQQIESLSSENEYLPSAGSSPLTTKYRLQTQNHPNLKNLSNFAMECDRYCVSDRVAAALASSLLKDLDVKDKMNNRIIIDKSKVRRERHLLRQHLLRQNYLTDSLRVFSFDSRKDRTLVQKVTDDNVLHPRMVNETHIVILQQPNSTFLGYIEANDKSKASETAKSIVEFFEKKGIDLSDLIGVCCDGEPKNTGHLNGILRNIENIIERPLHWFVCLLHFNELVFRHFFEKIDSSIATGPRTGTGTISKAIENVEKPIQNFRPIPFHSELLTNITGFDLSVDEKYLYDISIAVSSGICSKSLSNKKPGPMHHARWLTKACRILRLYISTEEPSKKLFDLAKFIIHVYVPMYFGIKVKSSCINGSIHFFNVIKFSRYLSAAQFAIVSQVCKNNSYFAHSENLILAMIFDENPSIRRMGYNKIIHSRNESGEEFGIVRNYIAPRIMFEAENFYDLIDWSMPYTEPPFTCSKSYDNIKHLAETCDIIENSMIEHVACHIQSTERHVQIVSQVSTAVAYKTRREGMIHAKLASHEKRPKFESKKDFV